ncbi:MAG: EamA family transporter [Candidatus Eisenbacteria bacterium]|nr:EamA family transporter [Candidatus Eisenbacteria bacterium]
MWIALAIVTALGFAATNSYAKTLSRSAHIFTVTWAMMLFSLPWALLMLGLRGMPAIEDGFYLAALGSVTLNMVAVTLQVKALSISPLSVTVPFLSLTPLFMLLTSVIVLGETPDTKGLLGIILIVIGGYTIHLEKMRGGFLAPLKAIGSEKGSVMMLLVAFLWSWTAAFDKVAVLRSSPAFYTAFFSVAFGVLYLPVLVVGLRKKSLPGPIVPRLFLLGAFSAAMILSQMSAIELTVASYVIAIKRAGAVVAVLLGYLFHRERHLAPRIAGAVLMTLGVVLISL